MCSTPLIRNLKKYVSVCILVDRFYITNITFAINDVRELLAITLNQDYVQCVLFLCVQKENITCKNKVQPIPKIMFPSLVHNEIKFNFLILLSNVHNTIYKSNHAFVRVRHEYILKRTVIFFGCYHFIIAFISICLPHIFK